MQWPHSLATAYQENVASIPEVCQTHAVLILSGTWITKQLFGGSTTMSTKPQCLLYTSGMLLVCFWYASGMLLICCWYAASFFGTQKRVTPALAGGSDCFFRLLRVQKQSGAFGDHSRRLKLLCGLVTPVFLDTSRAGSWSQTCHRRAQCLYPSPSHPYAGMRNKFELFLGILETARSDSMVKQGSVPWQPPGKSGASANTIRSNFSMHAMSRSDHSIFERCARSAEPTHPRFGQWLLPNFPHLNKSSKLQAKKRPKQLYKRGT